MRLVYLLLLALAAPALPADDPAANGRNLVLAMRLDEYYTRVAADAAAAYARQGKLTHEQLNCVQQFMPGDFTDDLGTALDEYLSDDELIVGLGYYLSPLGKRLTDTTLAIVDAHRAGKDTEDMLKLSDDDRSELSDFAQSSAGQKLLNLRALTDAEPIQRVFRARIVDKMTKCGVPPKQQPAKSGE